jgi:predicted AAA+ superfamily ATPase
MLIRTIEAKVDNYIKSKENKILFIWGPRRSGKTTLLNKVAKEYKTRIFNFDNQSDADLFIPRKDALEQIVKENNLILIDEVQTHPEATVALKLLHDEFNVKVIATGSSELRQKSQDFDSLAGRYIEEYCLPFSVYEIAENSKVLSYEEKNLHLAIQKSLQLYGAYPEVYANKNLTETEKIDILQNILDTYVLKDIISIYDLKNSKLAKDILTKIALQIGQEVSIREIANSLQANVATVSNYIEIFIKNYILIPLPSFKTNTRKAVSENRKLYFYDMGIRNILVKDFRQLDLRPDKGGVFENFIVSEIDKRRKNLNLKYSMYFYREYGGKEVDLVLEDYKKNYITVEVKTTKAPIKNIFPLPNTFNVVNTQNYFQKIVESLRPS